MTTNELITNRVIDALETGVAPWRKPWRSNGTTAVWAENLMSRKPYRGINQFLLHLNPYTSPYWLTYKQATELGGHVRKGEKGSPIVFVGTSTKGTEGEGEEKSYTFLRYYTVFNTEQCDGLGDKVPAVPMATSADHERIAQAESVVAGFADRPTIQSATQAWYRPATDTVGMPDITLFDAPSAYYATLFHELGHSTGHESRLRRDLSTAFGSELYGKEELVAEMASAFLCGHAGLDTIAPSASYLKSWITVLKGDSHMVVSAAAKAQQAFDYITGGKQS